MGGFAAADNNKGAMSGLLDPLNLSGQSSSAYGSSNASGSASTAPWAEQIPYLLQGFQQAAALPDIQAYTGQRVAGFDPTQSDALNALEQRYRSGDNLITQAQDVVGRTARGDYLDPGSNPYLAQTYQRALEQSLPSITSGSISAGRYGSGTAGMLSNDLQSRLANDIYGGNYQRERDRQMSAVSMAPGMSAADQLALYGVGAQRQGQKQAELGGQMAQFSEQQMAPWMTAANRKNLISGNYGGTTNAVSSGGKGN